MTLDEAHAAQAILAQAEGDNETHRAIWAALRARYGDRGATWIFQCAWEWLQGKERQK